MPHSSESRDRWLHPPLQILQDRLARECVECGLCVRECRFLQHHGTPARIAADLSADNLELAFRCSLCGLCTAVCPPRIGLEPAALFLAMRREAVLRNDDRLPRHRSILTYEKLGTSSWFRYMGLPEGCDTVFFPGCALPGTRPSRVVDVFTCLRRQIPSLGLVLDCCTKPSHDLGREAYFHTTFGLLRQRLVKRGIRRVLVACPNCYRVFKQYGRPLEVESLYQQAALAGQARKLKLTGIVTIHDACTTRFEQGPQQAVRGLVAATGLATREMDHHGKNALCCGEGGATSCLDPVYAQAWGERRQEEAGDLRVIAYCAGCTGFLAPRMPTAHILDLLFDPVATLAGRVKAARSPRTYLNRLLLKNRIRHLLKSQDHVLNNSA